MPVPVRLGDGQPATDHTGADTVHRVADQPESHVPGANADLRSNADPRANADFGANADLRVANDTGRFGTCNDPTRRRGGRPNGRQPPDRRPCPAANPGPESDAEPKPNL